MSLVSVIVAPREGFRQAPARLAELVARTSSSFDLIYVDGGSPPRIARDLKQLVRIAGGTLVRTETFLRPTTARNLGFREADTRYVVFLDNDVTVMRGWLDALVQCAEDTGAAFVSPVICIGRKNPPIVHVAGGVNELVGENGSRRLVERYAHATRPLADVLAEVERQQVTMAEFHAVLVRTDALRAIDGLDERCSTAFEHNDLCLSLAERGGIGWLEPTAVVDYSSDRADALDNAPYHLLRWNRAWIEESHRAFCEKWGLSPLDPAFAADLESLHSRRRRPTVRMREAARRVGGQAAVDRVDAWMDKLVDTTLLRHQHDAPPQPSVSRFSSASRW